MWHLTKVVALVALIQFEQQQQQHVYKKEKTYWWPWSVVKVSVGWRTAIGLQNCRGACLKIILTHCTGSVLFMAMLECNNPLYHVSTQFYDRKALYLVRSSLIMPIVWWHWQQEMPYQRYPLSQINSFINHHFEYLNDCACLMLHSECNVEWNYLSVQCSLLEVCTLNIYFVKVWALALHWTNHNTENGEVYYPWGTIDKWFIASI